MPGEISKHPLTGGLVSELVRLQDQPRVMARAEVPADVAITRGVIFARLLKQPKVIKPFASAGRGHIGRVRRRAVTTTRPDSQQALRIQRLEFGGSSQRSVMNQSISARTAWFCIPTHFTCTGASRKPQAGIRPASP